MPIPLVEQAPEITFEQVERLGTRTGAGTEAPGERAGEERPALTYRAENGSIDIRDGHTYQEIVDRLCELEEQRKPEERYTWRGPTGQANPRRGIELVLGRLHDYETRVWEA